MSVVVGSFVLQSVFVVTSMYWRLSMDGHLVALTCLQRFGCWKCYVCGLTVCDEFIVYRVFSFLIVGVVIYLCKYVLRMKTSKGNSTNCLDDAV
jgi:hypothetical protein